MKNNILDFSSYIAENKSVEVLYHFTDIKALYDMIKSDGIYLYSKDSYYTSFTRNFNMKSPEITFSKRMVRITVDSRKLKQRNKIKPFLHLATDRESGEWEERLDNRNLVNNTLKLNDYILRIDILENTLLPINYKDELYHTGYKLGDQYYEEVSDIKKVYNTYKQRIKIQNFKKKYPIFFVDRFKPYKYL